MVKVHVKCSWDKYGECGFTYIQLWNKNKKNMAKTIPDPPLMDVQC